MLIPNLQLGSHLLSNLEGGDGIRYQFINQCLRALLFVHNSSSLACRYSQQLILSTMEGDSESLTH